MAPHISDPTAVFLLVANKHKIVCYLTEVKTTTFVLRKITQRISPLVQ